MKRYSIGSGNAGLTFEADSGNYTVRCGNFTLEKCTPRLRLDGHEVPFGSWRVISATRRSLQVCAGNDFGRWRFRFATRDGEISMHLSGTLTCRSRDIELWYFDKVSLPAQHVLAPWIRMWRAVMLPCDARTDRDFEGSLQCLISENGRQLQLAFPLKCEHIPLFRGHAAKGVITGLKAGSEIRHYSRRRIALEPLTIRCGDGFELMRRYGRENSSPGRDFSQLDAPGWNSWDYYRWTVSEDAVLENAEFIASDPVLSRHVKKIIVDDGWQYAYGEWEANSLFPHGMAHLAEKIRALGFEPGLWVAPLIVEPHARIAQLNPGMLARSEGGLPTLCWECMKRNAFILDPTVSESRRFIYDTFERLASYGYRYFKLDFLGGVLNARQFARRDVGRGRLMELAVSPAREALKGRAVLLGCNYLYCGGPELVESVRIGGDIRPRWDFIETNAPSMAAMFWANRVLWLNDPDFALCRGVDTADDPAMNDLKPLIGAIAPDDPDRNHRAWRYRMVTGNRREMEVLLSLNLVVNGAINLSDRMSKLNASGLDMARRVVSAPAAETAVPLDLFSAELPGRWLQKTVNGGWRILLINWSSRSREFSEDLRKLGVYGSRAVNFWNDSNVPVTNGRIEAVLSPHSCLLIAISWRQEETVTGDNYKAREWQWDYWIG